MYSYNELLNEALDQHFRSAKTLSESKRQVSGKFIMTGVAKVEPIDSAAERRAQRTYLIFFNPVQGDTKVKVSCNSKGLRNFFGTNKIDDINDYIRSRSETENTFNIAGTFYVGTSSLNSMPKYPVMINGKEVDFVPRPESGPVHNAPKIKPSQKPLAGGLGGSGSPFSSLLPQPQEEPDEDNEGEDYSEYSEEDLEQMGVGQPYGEYGEFDLVEEDEITEIEAVNIFPNGFPDIEHAKGYQLKAALKTLPAILSKRKKIVLSLADVTLSDEERLMTGGVGSREPSGEQDEMYTVDRINDTQIRQILSAFKIIKEKGIKFNFLLKNNQVIGVKFDDPKFGGDDVELRDLIKVVTKALPGDVSKLYERNWRGKYGDVFGQISTMPGVEIAPFPDFSNDAQAITSATRPKTTLILQPTRGMGYLLLRELEFPTRFGSAKMRWDEGVSYFFNHINELAPNWRTDKANRRLLAFRSFLYGDYEHKRKDGSEIGRQGMVISRHAENSIDLLKAYVGKDKWSQYIRSSGSMPSGLLESFNVDGIARLITDDPDILVEWGGEADNPKFWPHEDDGFDDDQEIFDLAGGSGPDPDYPDYMDDEDDVDDEDYMDDDFDAMAAMLDN